MGKMKDVFQSINDALDEFRGPHKYKSCQEIADELGYPVEWVNDVVEQRWIEKVGKLVDEEMSPHATCNS
jgi:hypothetical protein